MHMLKPDFTYHHEVTVYPWLRRGIKADEYGDPVKIRCRVNFKRKLSYGAAGGTTATAADETVATGTVFMPAGTRVSPKDKLVFNGREYAVLSCLPSHEFNGNENHVEVEIQ